MSATEAQTSTSKLPDALAALAEYDQFIVWRSEPQANGGKPRKVPLNPETLTAADPHDPAHWMNADVAFPFVELLGANYGVGFVLTENDPFFCFDIDNCRGGEDWSPFAQDLINRLPGAAVEVSVSGNGLHVWGTYQAVDTNHGCRNQAHGIELYTRDRFIALGRHDAEGNATTDCTGALTPLICAYFPPSGSGAHDANGATWTTEPVAGYLPLSNDELIDKARHAQRKAVFDSKATFAHLWDADGAALAHAYPPQSPDQTYDASSADFALSFHLAFWTGNNCARIQTLMLQSNLRRDKWEREDYLPRTILNAIAKQTDVYTGQHREATEIVASPSTQGGRGIVLAETQYAVPYKDHNACFRALSEMQIEVRANTRKRARIEINEAGRGWSALTDGLVADLRDRIADLYLYSTMRRPKPLAFGIAAFHEHLSAASFRNQVDPFKLWLEALPAWDGTARLDNWITRLFAVESDLNLTVWASRYLFLGALQRTYEPGCKLDQIPVLIGPQGIGKSMVLNACLPNDKGAGLVELFTDGLHLAASPKERAEALEGRVIVEIAEMSGSTRADLESLKAFLTRTDDGDHRKAYARNPESSPRMCIIVATADRNGTLPNDPAGNRRFVVIEIKSSKSAAEAFMGIERDQLWAEAIQRYKAGERANLPREYATIQAAANEAQRADDVLEERIADMADQFEGKTSGEIANVLEFGASKITRAEQMRIANALQLQGFRRIGRGNRKVWTRPLKFL